MTTIKEIAESSGVSHSTVSRVLNNDPNVSDETRARVQAIIDELDFQPDSAAQNLTNGHTRVLGLVIPMAFSSLFTDPFFSMLSQGISATCTANDYTLMLWLIEPEAEKRTNNNILNNRLIEGVIFASNLIGDPLIEGLLARKIPMVVIGRNDNPQISTVDVDNIYSAIAAVQHLVDMGRKKLATITGDIQRFSGRDRLTGFKRGLEKNSLPILNENIAFGDFTEESGYLQAKHLLAQADFDGIFIASDLMAFSAIRAFREAGLNVPEDIAVVSYDDTPEASSHKPSLTTIRQPIPQLGSTAAQMLIDQLENDSLSTPQRVILPTELIIRETSAVKTS